MSKEFFVVSKGFGLGRIDVKNIRLYAYHGCLDEERIIGSLYRVDVSVWASLLKSSNTDCLEDTVDYVAIHDIVSHEMAIPSNLLEHVARRILKRVLSLALVGLAEVSISKINPPIGGDVESVSVILVESTESFKSFENRITEN